MSKASKNTSHRKLYTVGSDAPFQYVEAYKSLRTNLEFLSTSGNCKTILITSSVPEEGKSNVALNLAMTLTASGNRVVLVDCDLRKATISRYLRIPRNHTGLTNVITSKDEGALAAALVRVKDSGITVLTAGTIPPNPTELLSTPMTEKIFASLQKAFDYVIIDTPPVSVVTDAAVLCGIADGVLLVVRPGVTTIQSAQLSKKNLEAVNAHILGVVMNGYNGTWGNLYAALAYLTPGTQAYTDLQDTYNGVVWNTAYGNIDVSNTTASGVVIWADNCYSVDVTYDANCTHNGQAIDYADATMRIYFLQTDAGFVISNYETL